MKLVIMLLLLLVVACTAKPVEQLQTTEQPAAQPSNDGRTYCNEQRPEICTADYNPVCGSDGKTYSNACNACLERGVTFSTPGECQGVQVDEMTTIKGLPQQR